MSVELAAFGRFVGGARSEPPKATPQAVAPQGREQARQQRTVRDTGLCLPPHHLDPGSAAEPSKIFLVLRSDLFYPSSSVINVCRTAMHASLGGPPRPGQRIGAADASRCRGELAPDCDARLALSARHNLVVAFGFGMHSDQ